MSRLQQAVKGNGKTLLGAAVYIYDPAFLEICAHLGYQAIWIEMEHEHITFAEAANLCRTYSIKIQSKSAARNHGSKSRS